MKIKLLLSLLVLLLSFSTSYASFPVKKAATTNSSSEIYETVETYTPVAAPRAGQKDLTVGILLWFFLGGLAGHRWYYGKPVGWNILFILTLGGLGVWWVIDLINMLSDNF
ncbi:TM2 domain-containing protein [Seonamhaeicola maritimus]|uniref:TM2 domain-containing protein n=1 Tax=Seonamhaeicola maritimus TaxID=2591822 RepID=A0A5C7GLP3_9FLAO|nr:TM2 domain-containing protein [Seonamhaeicola maritimus]TXG39439.1 TM2 domain-containing protein [Seonamhaeicola maritimus]